VRKSALKGLSDNALLAQIQKLRRREHLSTLDILLHLNEVDRRRLHLSLGYASLFDYCVKHLKYSASAAGRRIQTARCIRRHPEVYPLLEKNEVNLMTISLIAPILTEANKDELLPSICGKTQRQVEAIASQYRPPLALRDRVRPVRVRVPESVPADSGQAHDAGGNCAQKPSSQTPPSPGQNRTRMSSYSQTGSDIMLTKVGTPSQTATSKGACSRIEQKLLIQFLANEAFMKKYDEVRALLSQRLSDTSFENVFEALINEFLERHCPTQRKKRREARRPRPEKARRRAATHSGRSDRDSERSRQSPVAVRDEVFVRDGGRCTYVGTNGKRCRSTHALQLDHVKPFARGGTNTATNLRLLSAKHNRLAAEKAYGTGFMRRFPPRE
jgi:5-methylcytosine-specific restriction endonuclease McrA